MLFVLLDCHKNNNFAVYYFFQNKTELTVSGSGKHDSNSRLKHEFSSRKQKKILKVKNINLKTKNKTFNKKNIELENKNKKLKNEIYDFKNRIKRNKKEKWLIKMLLADIHMLIFKNS